MKRDEIDFNLIQVLVKAAEDHFTANRKEKIETNRKYKKGRETWTPKVANSKYKGHDIRVNLVRSTVETAKSAAYSNSPSWIAKPGGPGQSCDCRVVEEWLDWACLPEGYDVVNKSSFVIDDGFESGAGYLEVGTKIVGHKQVEYEDEDADGNIVVKTKKVPDVDIFVERRSAMNVYVDPDAAEDMDSATFIIVKDSMPVYQLTEDERFDKAAREAIKGMHVSTAFKSHNRDVPDKFLRADLYDIQIMDAAGKRVEWLVTYCEEVNDLLRLEGPYPFPCKGFTLAPFVDYNNLDEFDPQGEIEDIIPLQKVINNIVSKQSTHVDRAAPKIGVDEKTAKNQNFKNALASDEVFGALPIDLTGGKKITDYLQLFSAPNMTADYYNLKNEATEFIERLSGISGMRLGVQLDTKRTATEVSKIETGADLRSKPKREAISKYFSRAGELLIAFMREVYTDERVIEAKSNLRELKGSMVALAQEEGTSPDKWVGPDYEEGQEDYKGPRLIKDGREHWLSFIGSNTPEGITVTIDPLSTAPKSKEADRMLFIALMDRCIQLQGFLVQLAQAGVPFFFNWAEFIKDMFAQFDIKDPDKYFDEDQLEQYVQAMQQQIAAQQQVAQAPESQGQGEAGADEGSEEYMEVPIEGMQGEETALDDEYVPVELV